MQQAKIKKTDPDKRFRSVLSASTLAGDSVTFNEEGFLKGVKVKVRETLAKKGLGKIQHKFEVGQGKDYQLMAEDTCTK